MPLMVLGPLDSGSVALSPRERVVLAALIVRRGKGVAPDELADALWGEEPPATWEQQVRNSIARIRARLGRESVETVAWEYRLAVDPESIDAVRFERLISMARQHLVHRENDRSVDAYRKALALWRGAPLPEIATWEPGSAEAARLNELHTSAQEELLDARLRAGEDRSVIPEAEQLVREAPLREDRWAILALANYRANRQADALAVLRSARARLDDELGIEPGPRISELETAILRHDPVLDPPLHPARESLSCPYPGLVPFGPDDAELFFGRDADIDAVQARLRPGTITAIAGPSGCGKSSLLLAGIVPELRRRGRSVEVMRPGAGGVPALMRLTRPDAGLNVLAIDQAEELVSAAQGDVDAFCAEVAAFLARGGAMVLTVRSDFLDRMGALPAIGSALGRSIHLLTGLDQVGLRTAIEAPAHLAGLRIEPGLTELVLRDAAGRPAVLPHLSHALVETWVRREGLTLTVDGYETAGGIPGAIGRSAERAYQSMSAGEQVACRSIMLRLIERDSTGASIRRRHTAAPLLEDPVRRSVAATLVSARLVAMDGDALIVAHEAVAEAWPRLDAWLQEDADGTRLMGTVATGAGLWDAGGRMAEDLLRGGRLQSAIDWRAASVPGLTRVEIEFLDASASAQQSELARERSHNRRLRWALSGVAALLVVALLAGGLAITQGRDAATAAEGQRIEALAAMSLNLRATERDVAALLAAEMHRRWPDDPRSRSAVLGSIVAAGGLVSRLSLVEGVQAAGALIPGTRRILLVTDRPSETDDGQRLEPAGVAIIDIDTWTVVEELDVDLPPLDGQFRHDVVVSGNGRIAAIQTRLSWSENLALCCVNSLTFVDLSTGEVLAGSQRLDLATQAVPVLSHSGDRMFTIRYDSSGLIAIDTHSGAVHADIPRPPGDYYDGSADFSSISLTADGRVLLRVDVDVIMYDPVTLDPIPSILVPRGYTESFVLEDGQGGILTGGDLGVARWDEVTGEVLWQRAETWCFEADITESGTMLCNDGSGTIVEREIATGEATGREYPTADWTVNSEVIPDSGEFLSFASGGTTAVSLWRIDDEPSITTPIAQGRSAVDGFGDHSGLIITAIRDGQLTKSTLWDVAADAAVGDDAKGLVWLSDSVVWRSSRSTGTVLEDVTTGRQYAVDRTGGDQRPDYRVESGGPGPTAFIVERHHVIPIDPNTGDRIGAAIAFPDFNLFDQNLSISELVDSREFAMTWWDPVQSEYITAVFDLETGGELRRGLVGDVLSAVTPEGEIVSAGTARVTRSSAALEPLFASSKSGVEPSSMQVAGDGRLLLMSGYDNSVSLYDLRDGRRLGDEIVTGWVTEPSGPSGYLSADGLHMVTNTPDGVLLWNLAPDPLFEASCRIAGRELTALEWNTYFGDEPQTATCAGVIG